MTVPSRSSVTQRPSQRLAGGIAAIGASLLLLPLQVVNADSNDHDHKTRNLILILVLSIGVPLICIFLLIIILCCRRLQKRRTREALARSYAIDKFGNPQLNQVVQQPVMMQQQPMMMSPMPYGGPMLVQEPPMMLPNGGFPQAPYFQQQPPPPMFVQQQQPMMMQQQPMMMQQPIIMQQHMQPLTTMQTSMANGDKVAIAASSRGMTGNSDIAPFFEMNNRSLPSAFAAPPTTPVGGYMATPFQPRMTTLI